MGATNHIRIVKRGPGSLYFSSAVEYYTNDENVEAGGSSDLKVTREYYRLRVEATGFKRFTREGLILQVAQVAEILGGHTDGSVQRDVRIQL